MVSDLLFVLVMTTIGVGLGFLITWVALKVFGGESLPTFTADVVRYKQVNPATHCIRCYHRFSDWFIWSTGRRYCYLCWVDSDYKIVIEERLDDA